jgi:diguanylate cyclase (GGDEF)-like protein
VIAFPWQSWSAFELQSLGAAVGVAALAALVLAYVLRKLLSDDRWVAAGWALGGAVAVGSGWWSAQLLSLVASDTHAGYRAEVLFAGWVLAIGAAGIVLLTAALLPTGWKRGLGVGLLLTLALPLMLRTTVALPALQPLPVLDDHDLLLTALWALVPCVVAGLLMTARRPAREGTPLFVRGIVGALVLTLAFALVQLSGLAALDVEASRLAFGDGVVQQGGVLRLAGVAALGVAVVLLSALVDLRARGRTRELAASLRDANQQLRQLAFCDPLTGLPNRLLFEQRLREALERVGRAPSGLAVLFIDLDGFKPINDSFGHAAGDEVLRQVGQRLEGLGGEREMVARIGGDEFLLLLEQPEHPWAASALAQRALRTLGQTYKLPNSVEVSLSCSIGIALFPQHGPMNKLIANADAAMYAAKGVGGSTFAFFEPRMDIDVREQVELQRDLRGAMERGELQLYYQPKVDARSAQVTGAEALVRWQHPSLGTVTPHMFIPVAERFGLIGALGAWVIDEACRQVREWLDTGLHIRVAVNLSVHQLRQEDLVPRIERALREHRVEPRLLSFEITESVAMEDTQATMRAFNQLAQLGVLLSIDDFGTGHSSLAYLRKLPARQLKIDRSFVADIEHSADAMAVVDAVVSLAHALGLRVVAEGVETEGQRDLLLGLRCDELQGFLIAKPMAPKSLALWVMEDTGPQKLEFQSKLFPDTVRSSLH